MKSTCCIKRQQKPQFYFATMLSSPQCYSDSKMYCIPIAQAYTYAPHASIHPPYKTIHL